MKKIIPTVGFNAENIGDKQYLDTFSLAFGQKFVYINNYKGSNDLVVLGGGNVIYPPYFKSLKKFNRKIALSVGLGKTCDFKSLEDFEKIVVRDKESLLNIQSAGFNNAIFAPDFAFLCNYLQQKGYELLRRLFVKNKSEKYKKVIVVALNSNVLFPQHPRTIYKEYEFQHFCNEMAKMCDNISASFIFVPFGTEPLKDEDRIVNSLVALKCKWYKKNVIIYERLSYQDVLNLISVSDYVIGMRLHSLIFSFLALTPFIGISIDSKFNNFCDLIGENRAYNYTGVNFKVLKNRIEDELNNPSNIKKIFETKVTIQKQILQQEIQILKKEYFDVCGN